MLLSFPWIKAAELLHFGVASSSPQMWLCLRKAQPLLDGGSWMVAPGWIPQESSPGFPHSPRAIALCFTASLLLWMVCECSVSSSSRA